MATPKTYKLKTPDGRTYATSDEAERDQLVRTRGYTDQAPANKADQAPANKADQAPANKAEAPTTGRKD